MRGNAVTAWCLYDWANSAFATTVMAAFFPPFFRSLATGAGLSEPAATAAWGYTLATALTLVAVLAPILGAIVDHAGGRKHGLATGVALGVVATAAFTLIGAEQWKLAALLYLIASLGFNGANVFYESLLPHVAPPGEMDRVSSRGYAFGYVGGGLLLALNVLWVTHPGAWGFTGAAAALRASFATVAVWWALFTLPLLRLVPEPPRLGPSRGPSRLALRAGLGRLRATLRSLPRYRQLSLFLLAYWLYNDGIGTIIKMATAYGDEIGIGLSDMVTALVLTQAVGAPCTLLCGRLAGRLGAKPMVLLTLSVYVLICVAGFFMRTAAHFYALAIMVGLVQGGSQALSRSLFASMVPRTHAAEFFGFFSTSGRFAGIAGPLLFGLISQWTGGSRLAILALIAFFLLGGLLLAKVDVRAGSAVAREVEAKETTVTGGALGEVASPL